MNKSPLLCVFRVGGRNFDTDSVIARTKMQPYRVETAGVGRAAANGLWYDIADHELITSEDLSSAIEAFCTRNKEDFAIIREATGIEYLDLDVGLLIDEGMVMRSLSLDPQVLAAIASAGIACTVSSYVVAEDNDPD